ncbi:LipA and NB-ARC domain protein [Aspergillus bombycis]|uniref:LipA and NB-ARC domain protein n=1 Tax=Aspergillus bombycis TaxID=109264 RepID=A0A1F7ZYS2_9EURO|nr:LipA and NB-ARC domain protein [Aspergillus bombycis]OGM44218.1 LipA and NB-ARC domain protein [Aspergillus bombycis]
MSTHQSIKRKPVALPPQETGIILTTAPRPQTSNGKTSNTPTPTLRPTTSHGRPPEPYAPPPPYYQGPNVAPPVPKSPINLRPPLQTSLSTPPLRNHKSTPNLRNPPSALTRSATELPPPGPNAIQKAYGEVSHFLGGLIAHPTESTRHYTILRHSHGIVFYRGSTTSIAISIFSDTPLPADRTYFLQSRGWTGKTGMKAKALFRLTDDWLDVTPSFALRANQVSPGDERAWQRDINKFRKKAPSKLLSHKLRETIVARIPAEAGDGYFQLNLCQSAKKKVLCSSPVFRVLSTSLDPSSLRGASLSTMPLEVGAMVLSTYAQTAAQAILNPVTSAVSNRLSPYKPGTVTQTAAETAYSLSGVEDSVARIRNRRGNDDSAPADERESRARQIQQYQKAAALENGPQSPFPMDFKARTQPQTQGQFGETSRCTLTKVPDTVLDKLRGYFLAWARYDFDRRPSNTPPKSPIQSPSSPYAPYNPDAAYLTPSNLQDLQTQGQKSPWYPTILSISPLNPSHQSRVNLNSAMQKTTLLRFIDEIHIPTSSRVQIRVMCFLRPDIPPPSPSGMTERDLLVARERAAEAEMLAGACDIDCAQGILEHPAWAPEVFSAPERQGGWLGRTREGMENARTRTEKMVEKVPLHWIGVRSATAEMRDRQVEVNGFYIVR